MCSFNGYSAAGQVNMSVPAIFGSAMVAFALIPAACIFVSIDSATLSLDALNESNLWRMQAMPGKWLRLQTW
jgi:hypothetical protein